MYGVYTSVSGLHTVTLIIFKERGRGWLSVDDSERVTGVLDYAGKNGGVGRVSR